MRSKIFVSAIILLVFLSNAQTYFAQELKTLEYAGLERSYLVNLPSNYDEASPSPLLIALHGADEDGLNFQLETQIDEIARDSGYIAVFPNGYQGGWNFLDENEMAQEDNWTDDVGFLNTLIDQLIADYNVNTRRIFIVGFSNGGLMALRAGCELDDRIAGIAAVAATYSFELAVHCATTVPTPTILVWGNADEMLPPEGFIWVRPDGKIRSSLSLNQTRSYLLTHFQCQAVNPPAQVEGTNSAYPIQREIYNNCGTGTPAFFYYIIGETHRWPDTSKIIMLDGTTEGSIEMTFFEVFDHIQRPN